MLQVVFKISVHILIFICVDNVLETYMLFMAVNQWGCALEFLG